MGLMLVILAFSVGLPTLGFSFVAIMDTLTGSRARAEAPFAMWALWGIVFGAALVIWLEAPLYGWRSRRWVILTLPLVALFCVSTVINALNPVAVWPADPPVPPPAPQPAPNFAGTWDTGRWGPMALKQDGMYVSGSYTDREGVISGTVSNMGGTQRLMYRWRNGDGANGVGYFDLSADAQSFSGRWVQGETLRDFHREEWNGRRTSSPPPPPDFTGNWDTEWGEVRLNQGVRTVTGTYHYRGGTIEGNLDGNVLRFRWVNRVTGETGTGKFILELYGERFSGSWNKGEDPDAGGELWNGTRKTADNTAN